MCCGGGGGGAVGFANYNEPMQGRLMLTGRPSEMRVMWTTRDALRPQVKFGTRSGMIYLCTIIIITYLFIYY
jgi:hypothetical protein